MIEPATEAVLEEVPRAGVDDVDEAVAAREGGVPGVARDRARQRAPAHCGRSPMRWPQSTSNSRVLEARNAGKPIGDARGEIGMAIDTFRYYAGAPERLLGDTIPVAGGQAFTVREPLGVVGLITPWNFPLTIASWKLGPALAAGNTVVLKPAELTPLTAMRFRAVAEAGIPEGVVNVVVGPGARAASGSSSIPTSPRSRSPGRPRSAARSRSAPPARSSASRSSSAASRRT